MATQNLIPGAGFVNETVTQQNLVPGSGFVNETVAAVGATTGAIPLVGRGPGMALAGPGGLAGNNMGAHR